MWKFTNRRTRESFYRIIRKRLNSEEAPPSETVKFRSILARRYRRLCENVYSWRQTPSSSLRRARAYGKHNFACRSLRTGGHVSHFIRSSREDLKILLKTFEFIIHPLFWNCQIWVNSGHTLWKILRKCGFVKADPIKFLARGPGIRETQLYI